MPMCTNAANEDNHHFDKPMYRVAKRGTTGPKEGLCKLCFFLINTPFLKAKMMVIHYAYWGLGRSMHFCNPAS